ncbi:MAG: lysozyme inhibitor LprI family protein [Pseudomonadota bacterium]
MRTALAVLVLAGGLGAAHASDLCDSTTVCANAQTTVDLVNCGSKVADAADAKLNELWPKVLNLYDGYTDEENAKKELRQAQNDWIKFRDATCRAEYNLADGGTIAGIYSVECTCAVTAHRIADFERMISLRGEGN